MNDTDITYERSNDLLHDARHIIDQAKERAFHSVNVAMLQRNWLLGQRITEEVLKGDVRAEYGAEIVKKLSVELTNLYGKGFNKNNLYAFVQFYKIFPTLSVKSELLTWSHYVLLLSIDDNDARQWYVHEAYTEGWSVRTLRRNIGSQYYQRLLLSQNRQPVIDEMKRITSTMQEDKLEFPGILYRGGAEQKIRKYLVQNNFIDTIIQLPSNLFFGASIATCIIVLKKNKADNRVCFIDASQEFIHEGNKNKLSEANQKRIYEAHMAKEEEAHFCHIVTTKEIEEEDFNLSVSTYVEQEDTREAINIDELNAEIAEIVKRQSQLRTQLDAIIKELQEDVA